MESDELAARELVLFVPFEITLSYLVWANFSERILRKTSLETGSIILQYFSFPVI